MSEGTSRVDFNAPESLVEEADAVAELLDTSRTRLLVEALRDRLDEIATDETFRRRLREAYYADRVDFEVVETVLGREEAMRLKELHRSLGREPPAPESDDVDLPSAEDFYDGELSEWTPEDDGSEDGDESTDWT